MTPLVNGAGSGLACGSDLFCSTLAGGGGRAAAAAAISDGFAGAIERVVGMAASPGSAAAGALLDWAASAGRDAVSASATSTVPSAGLRSVIAATVRLVAAF